MSYPDIKSTSCLDRRSVSNVHCTGDTSRGLPVDTELRRVRTKLNVMNFRVAFFT